MEMGYEPLVYLGVDPSQRYRPYVYAALDSSRKIIALGNGPLRDILSYTAGLNSAMIAINAPQSLNKGLLVDARRERKLFDLDAVKEDNMRLAEAQLAAEGIRVPRTPSRKEDCMVWMRRGFKLYERLITLGYYPAHKIGERSEHSERRYIESIAEAAYCRWIGGASLFTADSLEGRLQRQLILLEQKVPVNDAMSFFEEVTRFRLTHGQLPLEQVYESGELNALACANLAWLHVHQPHKIETAGDEQEGRIYLPAREEKPTSPIWRTIRSEEDLD